MAQNKRKFSGGSTRDEAHIANVQHNETAGAEKNMDVGAHLLPLQADDGIAWTTNATTIKALPSKGRSLAVYNNAGTAATVTLGESSSQASLGVGAADSSGHVGIPCTPNSWTHISCGASQFVIASAATLFVFLIDDESSI